MSREPQAVWLWPFVLGAALALLAVGILVSVIVVSRLRKISLRQAARQFVSCLWAVPVIAVLILVAVRVLPQLGIHVPGLQTPAPPALEQVVLGEATVERREPGADPTSLISRALTPSSDRPEWVDRQPVEENGRMLEVVSSGQYVTEQEAEDDALAQAASLLRTDIHRAFGYEGEWSLPTNVVREQAVRRTNVEDVERVIGGRPMKMRRVHLQVELSPEVRDTIAQTVWRPQIVRRRLWSLGSIVGMAVLVVVAVAVYLRLDSSTDGMYRRRLKLATVLLIIAGGLLATVAADQQLLAHAGRFLHRQF